MDLRSVLVRCVQFLALAISILALPVIADSGGNKFNNSEVTNYYADTVIRLPAYSTIHYALPANAKDSARILFWTPAYGEFSHWSWWFSTANIESTCPEVSKRCHFTSNRTELDASDAILFMTYGSSMRLGDNMTDQLPDRRKPSQRWVHVTLEAPNKDPKTENLTSLAGLFNWTMNYRVDADVYAPFGRLVLSRLGPPQRQQSLALNYASGRSKMAAWYVSHCQTEGRREDYAAELQRHLSIDIYGACGNLTCEPPRSNSCYRLLGQYKFYLSFENIICTDYASEKFFNALAYGVVPVVFGGANYATFAPPNSYIDALAFPSPKQLADYLKELDADDRAYNKYFDWRRGYDVQVVKDPNYVCELCQKLLDPSLPLKTYDDLHGWWHEGGNCRSWTPPSKE